MMKNQQPTTGTTTRRGREGKVIVKLIGLSLMVVSLVVMVKSYGWGALVFAIPAFIALALLAPFVNALTQQPRSPSGRGIDDESDEEDEPSLQSMRRTQSQQQQQSSSQV